MKLHTAALALVLAVPGLAWASEAPERVLRLNYVEGDVALQAADDRAPTALPDRPLIPGDRLITQRRGRAELALDTSAIRLDERSELRIGTLEAMSVRMDLHQGVASLRLGELLEGESFEIATANASITMRVPGEYRVEVPEENLTVLTVRSGAADVATATGPVRIASGQRVRLAGREAQASLESSSSTDDFDDWVLEREVQVAEAAPFPYGFEERDRYDELDRNGNWYDDSAYGRVWMPDYAYGSWDQFSYGRWERSGRYGWSWVSGAPWGFFTFNSGRWAYLHDRNRWCWVPDRRAHMPRVARESHPFGHSPRTDTPTNQPRNAPPAQPSRERHVLGTGTRNPTKSPAEVMPKETGTLRPSGSPAPRTTTAPASTTPRTNVFAKPKYQEP